MGNPLDNDAMIRAIAHQMVTGMGLRKEDFPLRFDERGEPVPTPRSRANYLVEDAVAAFDEADALLFARAALVLNPAHPRAKEIVEGGWKTILVLRLESLREAVAEEKAALGAKAFKKLRGEFWQWAETRPYMEALADLGQGCVRAGALDEAITIFKEMVDLNPNDNQGVRYELLCCLFATNRTDEAAALIKAYEAEAGHCAPIAWGRLLSLLLEWEDGATAAALAAARRQNPYVEAYLRGDLAPPAERPEYYSPGGTDEAIIFGDMLLMAWRAHPNAIAWLKRQPRPGQEGA